MNRVLLTTSMMTPAERVAGRFMRAPDEHPAGTTPAGTPPESGTPADNKGSNSDDSQNQPEGEDNAGKKDDLAGFWDGKAEEPKPAESEESKQEATQLGGELKGIIDQFTLPAPVFTKEIGEQIAEGNFDGANKLIAEGHQAAIRSSIAVTSKLIGAVVTRLQADFDTRINAALGNKDNSEFLKSNFPQAKNPTLAPMVERVWNQALVNSKGNREDAIRLTRGMLGAMGKEFAPDDIRNPPDDLAGLTSSNTQSLVDSLLDRG